MWDWLSYTPSDFLLFSVRTYYRLFELYNQAIWPAQIPALMLGGIILWLLHRGDPWQGPAVAGILSAGWLWTAWAFLVQHYDTINWVARYLAIGFAAEALLLVWAGLVRRRLSFRPYDDWIGRVGLFLFLFALALQPLIAALVGRDWRQAEILGLTPDPTVVATLGILLTAKSPPWSLTVLPLFWCAISGMTLWTMGAPDAWVMLLAGLTGAGLATGRVMRAAR